MVQYDMAPDYSIDPNHVYTSDDSENHLADFGVQEDQWNILGRSTAECAETLLIKHMSTVTLTSLAALLLYSASLRFISNHFSSPGTATGPVCLCVWTLTSEWNDLWPRYIWQADSSQHYLGQVLIKVHTHQRKNACFWPWIQSTDWNTHTHTQPFYCWSVICPGPPGSAGTRKVKPRRLKPIWIYWSKR